MPALDPLLFVSWESETARGQTEPLPTDLRDRVISLSFADKARGADELSLKLANTDLSLFDDPRLAEGNKLIVQWGYPHEMRQPIETRIKEVKGWSTLDIKCAGARELDFIAVERARTWQNSTITEVAQEIAREIGFTQDDQLDVDEGDFSVRYEGISQAGESDYAFLQRLADSEDMVFRVSGNKFHFHPPRLDDTPQITLTYFDSQDGQIIGEPQLEKGTLGIPGQVTRRGHSTREREGTEGEGSNATDTNRVQLGDMITVRNPETHTWLQRSATRADIQNLQSQSSSGPSAAGTDEQAETNARGNFRRGERQTIELTMTIVGMPNLRADSTIRFEGGGQKLTGNYYVEEVGHEVSGGYTCKLKLKRNAQSGSSSGRQAGTAQMNAAQQRILGEQERLNAKLISGDISQEDYVRSIVQLSVRSREIKDNAADRSGGRVNNDESQDENQLVPQTYRNEETGQWNTRWVRSTDASSSGNRTGGDDAG